MTSPCSFDRVVLWIGVLGLLCPSSAIADPGDVGILRGSVVDAESGKPLDYANILVLGTTRGCHAVDGGQFHLQGVPVGVYEVQASYIGHLPQTVVDVRIEAAQTTVLHFVLKSGDAGKVQTVVVRADRRPFNVDESSTSFTTGEEAMLRVPAESVEEIVAMNTGVVVQAGQLHVRGSRAGETSIRIDGVPVDDPLSGGKVDLALISIAQSELITGGMDAEYGNASSGIINYTTKSGGPQFEGNFRYQTDDYGRADKTFTNYDRFALSFGGPTPFRNLTWYASGEATFQDGEFLTTRRYAEHEFLGGLVRWKERASNQLRTQARLDWKPGARVRMTGELTLSHVTADPYTHNWNTEGYVARILEYPRIRANRFRPGFYVTQGTVSVYEGPWRQRAAQATFVDVREDPQCVHCLLPQSNNAVLRGVRVVDLQGRGSNPAEPPLYALIDFVIFEGYQTPTSDWTPELAGAAGDTNKQYYNSAEHVTTFRNTSTQLKWSMTHTLSPKTFYDLKISRLSFDTWNTVNTQTPSQYATAGKFVWVPGRGPQRTGDRAFYTDENVPYFVTAYDSPIYNRRDTVTWLVRSDVTSRHWEGHKIKAGAQASYNDLDNADFSFPGEQRVYGAAYGQGRNTFHTFNPEGAFYIQDAWTFEGMVVNAGVRYDFFSPGSGVQVELNSSDVSKDVVRWQSQWSPRLGLAFPITDRDVFHFHYGRFIQFPDKSYLFASQDVNASIGGLIGNPNLQPETSISYQAGIKHQFTHNLSGQFAVFNKDVYDLVSSIQVTDDSTGQTPIRYINKAFGSSRGIELSLARTFSNHFAFDASYTYSYADGVASNADFGRRATGLTYLPNGELPLNWDQRHTFNGTLTVSRPGDWSGTLVYQYGSGLPWTPVQRFEKKQDPLLENSRRFPSTHTVKFRGEKFFRIHGRTLRLFFDGRNLLNQAQVFDIDPLVAPTLENAREGYRAYASEQGRYGGAYLKDTDGDGTDEFFPVHDPRVFAELRVFRVGLGYEF